MSDIAKRGAAAPRAIEKNGKGTNMTVQRGDSL
jgi:hypothetical protein